VAVCSRRTVAILVLAFQSTGGKLLFFIPGSLFRVHYSGYIIPGLLFRVYYSGFVINSGFVIPVSKPRIKKPETRNKTGIKKPKTPNKKPETRNKKTRNPEP
jgi:hypothetical protein